MNYLSVCSGIEAASAAWHPLGWKPWAFAEIEKFPGAVLKHHYPDVPNLGDMTKFKDWPDAVIDVLVGGTPCQSYSVAGLRKGLDDPRGDLMLTYVAIARRYRPSWVVWENVPGVLSDDEGRSFGTLLGLLTGQRIEVPSGGWESAGFIEGYKSAYGIAWRILDSQFVRVDGFGRAVPQRRRRVFVVGYLGDWRRAAAVLFERESLSGNPAPRRESGKGIAPTISARTKGGGGLGTDFDCDGGLIPAIANPLTARMHKGVNTTMDEGQTMVAHSLRADGFDASEDGTGRGTPLVPIAFDPTAGRDMRAYSDGSTPGLKVGTGLDMGWSPAIAFSCKDHGADGGDIAPTLRSMGHDGSHANGGGQVAVAFQENQRGEVTVNDTAGSLKVGGGKPGQGYPAVAFQPRFARNGRGAPDTVAAALTGEAGRTGKGDSAQCVATAWAVRRLTPTECERLQGFPDNFTNIPWRGKDGAPDGPRYKALGNSMSVNVMRWVGTRIQMVEEIHRA